MWHSILAGLLIIGGAFCVLLWIDLVFIHKNLGKVGGWLKAAKALAMAGGTSYFEGGTLILDASVIIENGEAFFAQMESINTLSSMEDRLETLSGKVGMQCRAATVAYAIECLVVLYFW